VRESLDTSAEGAIPPRNLSGTRTARTRQLWSSPSTQIKSLGRPEVTEGEAT